MNVGNGGGVMQAVKLAKTTIEPGMPCYIVAEMSANHGGKLSKAIEILRAAQVVGANAVKLQTYRADTLTLDVESPDFLIPADNPWAKRRRLFELYSRAATPWDWHPHLFEEAHRIGIDIFSSPFDETAVDFLEPLRPVAYKIASPEITHIPLLEKVARTGRPVILSTGLGDPEDIELALATLKGNGCSQIILLHCASSYPASPQAVNLRTMVDMQEKFKCLVGLSDHTLGIGVPIAAAVLGACLIEKHFILNKDDDSEDAFFSSDQIEFKHMVEEIRKAEAARGSIHYGLSAEAKQRGWGRRSLYVSQDIAAGGIITQANIQCVRPSFGLHPKYYHKVLGKRVRLNLKKGDRLSFEVIDWDFKKGEQ